jgi:tetratricopeptide (TPR) repeat protein
MTKRAARRVGMLAAAALFGLAISIGTTFAAGGGGGGGSGGPDDRYPKPPSSDDKKSDKGKPNRKSDREFLDGYYAARAMVLDGNYAEAIAAFHALDEDDHPDVANYIGYAERKLGHYQASKDWYERALAANPNHVRTWQYYGMWHVEQGNMLKAEDFLEKIHLICGNTTCQEYLDLKGAIEGTVSY